MYYIMQVLPILLIAGLASPNACRSQETSETVPQDSESWTFGAVEAARLRGPNNRWAWGDSWSNSAMI